MNSFRACGSLKYDCGLAGRLEEWRSSSRMGRCYRAVHQEDGMCWPICLSSRTSLMPTANPSLTSFDLRLHTQV